MNVSPVDSAEFADVLLSARAACANLLHLVREKGGLLWEHDDDAPSIIEEADRTFGDLVFLSEDIFTQFKRERDEAVLLAQLKGEWLGYQQAVDNEPAAGHICDHVDDGEDLEGSSLVWAAARYSLPDKSTLEISRLLANISAAIRIQR